VRTEEVNAGEINAKEINAKEINDGLKAEQIFYIYIAQLWIISTYL